jgi:sigma-B regulation protein RsbU (phosphoserine phosphatase)
MRILIAEDDALTQELLASILKKLGHLTTVAGNGREAWEIFQQREEIQVLISDWLMPQMDGLELCRLVRALRRPHYTYIILLTALKGKQNHLQGLDAGADDFMSKPLEPDYLEARLCVAERILELRYEVAQLQSLLPICSYCKKIRDEEDAWMPVESYIAGQTGADLTHGICPDCYNTVVKTELAQLKKQHSQSPQKPGDTWD